MNITTVKPIILALALLAVTAVVAVNQAQAANLLLMDQPAEPYVRLAQGDGGMWLYECQKKCGATPPYIPGKSGDRGAYFRHAKCIQECNERHWKDFQKPQDEQK